MHKMTIPTSASTARTFLAELADAGMLFHPEEDASDCLASHNLPADKLAEIGRCMAATFDYLDDPCEDALALINRAAD